MAENIARFWETKAEPGIAARATCCIYEAEK
jgi:hypothetical protein